MEEEGTLRQEAPPRSVTIAPLFTPRSLRLAVWFFVAVVQPAFGDEPVGEEYYARWLDEVALLVESDERRLFHELSSDEEREEFIHEFWRARAGAAGAQHERLRWGAAAALARGEFGSLDDDRARLTLVLGPATHHVAFALGDDVIEPCGVFKPFHILYYAATPERSRFYAVFHPSFLGSPRYQRWRPHQGIEPLLAWTPSELRIELLRKPVAAALEQALDVAEERGCLEARPQLRGMIEAAILGETRAPDLESLLPSVDSSWIDAFGDGIAAGTRPRRGDPSPSVELSYRPHRDRTMIALEIELGERELWSAPARDGYRSMTAIAEIVSGGGRDLLAVCSQTFWLPGAPGAPARQSVHLLCDAPAGEHLLVLRVHAGAEAPARRVLRLEVPALGAVEPRLDRLAERLSPALSLNVERPPIPILGRTTLEAQVLRSEVVAVRFLVDGAEIGVDMEAPFEIAIEHGMSLGRYHVEAVAVGAGGSELGRDSVDLDAAPRKLRLRLDEVLRDDDESRDSNSGEKEGEGERRAIVGATVDLPPSATIDGIDFFVPDGPLASLTQEPWMIEVALPEPGPLVLRAAVRLRDGRVAEDALLLGGTGVFDRVDVRVVELYATAEGRATSVEPALDISQVEVFEDGRPQRILEIGRADRLPLSIAVLADGSTSMGEELALERAAALRFFRAFLGPDDRGSFLLFNDRVNQVVPFTDDLDWLQEGTRTLRARGGTALYDSLAVALHAFGGIRGRRAIVLFSDGHDEHSSLDHEGVRDLLRRAGVTLYAVHLYELDALPPGLTLPGDGRKRAWRAASRDRDTSRLRALARATGGVFQSVRNESQLDDAFRRIDADLRTQYRIVYQSSNTDEDPVFRTIEVRSRRRGISFRAPAGYLAD